MNYNLLKRMVEIPSVYPEEGKLAKFLLNFLTLHGFTVVSDYIDDCRFNILAEFKPKLHPKILFYGHIDTARTNLLPGWRTPPFSFQVSSSRLSGLGVYDMKGGIFAFLQAIISSQAPAKVLLCVDEENISQGCWSVVSKHKKFFTEVRLIVSAEPNFGLGDHSVTISRPGRYVFDMTFTGNPVHIALQKTGTDAVFLAGEFLHNFYADRSHLFSSRETVSQVRKVSGESVGMSVPASVQLEVEVLPKSKDSQSSVRRVLQKYSSAQVSLHPRPTPYLSGYSFSTFSFQTQVKKIIKSRLNKSMLLVSRSSVADDNVLATLGIPVITWGPSGGNAHAANEYIEVKSLNNFVAMYSALLLSQINLVK